MAYDAARSCLVLFGGYGESGERLGDTWEWSSMTGQWTLRATTGPEPRGGAGASYDTLRQTVILHGGQRSGFTQGGFWEWNGAWTVRSGGPVRYESVMAYDAGRDRALVLTTEFPEAWEFNAAAPKFPPAFSEQPPDFRYANPGQSIEFHAPAVGTPAPSLQWMTGSYPLANSGAYSGATTQTLTINPVSGAHSSSYSLVAWNSCGWAESRPATLFVTVPPPNWCYPDCDGSHHMMLTANDFQCFLNAYSAGHPYANCDRSSTPPVLTANDFQCFLDAFARGCPQ